MKRFQGFFFQNKNLIMFPFFWDIKDFFVFVI